MSLHSKISIFLALFFCGIGVSYPQWTVQNSGTTQNLNAIEFVDENNGWVVGKSGVIRHTNDGGTTWVAQTSPVTQSLYDVVFIDNLTGWVVGDNGVVLITNDGGTTWQLYSCGTNDNLKSVAFWDYNTGIAVGGTEAIDLTAIYKTTDGGSTWTSCNHTTGESMSTVVYRAVNQPICGGGFGNYFRSSDGGTTWSSATLGVTNNRIYSMSFIDASTGWLAGYGGIIFKTTDGFSFSAQTSGTTKRLGGIYFVSATTGWAVGDTGTIMVSTNSGTTWVPQTSNTQLNLNAVDFVNIQKGWACGSNGVIINTVNGGGISGKYDVSGTGEMKVFMEQDGQNIHFEYSLANPGQVGIYLFDNAGRHVISFYEGRKPVGRNSVINNVECIPPGVYYYKAIAGEKVKTGKIVKCY